MAKTKKKTQDKEVDSIYFLKLVMYLILGSFWLRLVFVSGLQLPLPIGLIIGLLFASREKFQIDRKIEYALLLIAMFVGFWLPIGINISF